MPLESAGPVVHAAVAGGLLVGAALVALGVSRWTGWAPAGPIALLAAAPILPRVPLFASLSADDLLPLAGLAILIWRQPVPRLTSDRVLRWILVAAAIATLARIASALVNGGVFDGNFNMLAQAIARPIVLVAIVAYVALAAPREFRHRHAAISIAAVATFEALFGLLGFLVRLPAGAGIEAAHKQTSLYGVCPGRITGTLGLSANHLGAVFVLSLPVTLGVAMTQEGWRRWAWATAAAVQAAGLILTFTRSSILLAAVLSIGLLIYQRRFLMLATLTALSTGILVFAFTISCTGAPIAGRISEGNDRLALWYSAGIMMLDHPLVGVGLDQMKPTVAANPDRYLYTPFGPATSSAHNTILLAGAETGIVGALGILGINIGLAVVAARLAWRGRRRDALTFAAALALAGYLAQGMVNNLFSVPASSVMFALLIGAFAATRWAGGAEPPPDPGGAGVPPTDPYTSAASDGSSLGGDR